MKSFFKRRFVYLSLLTCLAIMGSSPAIAKVDCEKRPDHPACTDSDDGTVQLGPGNDSWPGIGDDNTGDDIVYGGDGDDFINGGQGNDDLYGEAGDDLLDGQDGDDRLNGGNGIDRLFGGAGSDHLYVDGTESGDFANGGEGHDYLHLRFLDNVYVEFEDSTDPSSVGTYDGEFYEKGVGLISVKGSFRNIEFIYGSDSDGIYHGNDLANTIWGSEGNDEIYGYGGDDYLRGGGITLSKSDHIGDYINGGEGNDRISGLRGNDYIVGGPGDDDIWITDTGNHDVVEDFESGDTAETGDKILIYNSGVCWPDLTISTIDWDGDGFEDDTQVAWRVKNRSASITLLDFDSNQLSANDFVFEVEGEFVSYPACP